MRQLQHALAGSVAVVFVCVAAVSCVVSEFDTSLGERDAATGGDASLEGGQPPGATESIGTSEGGTDGARGAGVSGTGGTGSEGEAGSGAARGGTGGANNSEAGAPGGASADRTGGQAGLSSQ